jgi:YD repeat-containing protein
VDDIASTNCPASLPATGSNHLASYIYDTAANGIGQLYRVSWGPTPSQNRDTFTYDSRGRLFRQTRLIDNRSYVMETSFDALNRPLAIKYPTGELVNLTYDREGEYNDP